jgi:hypothetical protein
LPKSSLQVCHLFQQLLGAQGFPMLLGQYQLLRQMGFFMAKKSGCRNMMQLRDIP